MSKVIGLIEVFSAVLLIGCVFVPLKKFGAGDGFFAQWLVNASFLLVGFVVFAFHGFPPFYPLAMLGGACWATANLMSIPIINRVGMCLGILIWNSVNCVAGFLVSYVGLFGIDSQPTSSPALSFVGLPMVLVGGIIFGSVRTTRQDREKLEDPKQRAIGLAMAVLSGFLYTMNLLPVMYIQHNPETFHDAPEGFLPYVFSHTFGAFTTSTIAFAVYAIVRKNDPWINERVALPALFSGLILGCGQSLNFSATHHISGSVTYPISAMLIGCVAAVWDVFYFREIRGKRNLSLLLVAILITVTGAILIGVSK